MNYKRIYAQFIDDRKARNVPHGYSEKHHILPKSLGGTDSPENLIRLTPEDHYFAHLLLAKIHGGDQWASVKCMAVMANDLTKYRKVFASRYMVGVARRKSAAAQSKRIAGVPRPDRQKIATLFNVDGRSETGSLSELVALTGLNLASISRICKGRQGQSHCGWFVSASSMRQAKDRKSALGSQAVALIAGQNKKMVRRIDCGTVYRSVTEASKANATCNGNIARAIRKGMRAGGSNWAYA